MIALAWSFFMVLSMVLASSQAFITAPVPGYGLSDYASTVSASTEKSPLLGDSPGASVPMADLMNNDDDDDDNVDDLDDSNSNSNGSAEDDYPMGGQPPPRHKAQAATGRRGNEQQTVYVIEFETEADSKGEGHRNRGSKDMPDDGSDGQSPLDPWSIVWYIGSFGGLVAFFLIVSCSEWCCRRGARPLSVPYTQRGEVINANGQPATESPPPPYHLFAPPPYDSVNYADLAQDKSTQGEKLDIYVITVPVQQLPPPPTLQPPPA